MLHQQSGILLILTSKNIVGGHCISVDPYYLASKARDINFQTKFILSGRSTNDNMGLYISKEFRNFLRKKY